MGSDEKKKQRERFLLDRFLEHQGITPTRIVPGESPDFLIDLEGRTVGIELTELFIRSNKSEANPKPAEESLLKRIESNADRIMSRAREIYFLAGNPPVLSKIVISDRITLDKKKGDQIAELIAYQIQSMSLENSQAVKWRSCEEENEKHPLLDLVYFIHTERVPELRFAHWTVVKAGLVAPLTPEYLQAEIDKKAKKIDTYRKKAEEIWLLIVADPTQLSQKFSVPTEFPICSVSSPFTKTLYYGYAAEDVIDLTKKVETNGVVF
ncbi:MAG: hypothetical protein ABSE87_12065 [Terracidiphilus sp.]